MCVAKNCDCSMCVTKSCDFHCVAISYVPEDAGNTQDSAELIYEMLLLMAKSTKVVFCYTVLDNFYVSKFANLKLILPLFQAATFEVLLVRNACLFDVENGTMMFTCGKLFQRPSSDVRYGQILITQTPPISQTPLFKSHN